MNDDKQKGWLEGFRFSADILDAYAYRLDEHSRRYFFRRGEMRRRAKMLRMIADRHRAKAQQQIDGKNITTLPEDWLEKL